MKRVKQRKDDENDDEMATHTESIGDVGTLELTWIETHGTPKPEPRPEATAMPTKPKPTARVYVPKTAHPWKHAIRAATVEALGVASPIPEPRPQAFVVAFVFKMPRPKNHYGTGRNAGRLKPWAASMQHVSTPDLDNLIKAAKDAIGDWDDCPALVWADDSQVVRYVGDPVKRYVHEGEAAGLTMVVMPVGPVDVLPSGAS